MERMRRMPSLLFSAPDLEKGHKKQLVEACLVSEDKLMLFDSVCKVVGVQLDLNSAKLGKVFMSNARERIPGT